MIDGFEVFITLRKYPKVSEIGLILKINFYNSIVASGIRRSKMFLTRNLLSKDYNEMHLINIHNKSIYRLNAEQHFTYNFAEAKSSGPYSILSPLF